MKENGSKKFYNQIITAETRKLLDRQCQKSMRSRPKQIEYLVKRESILRKLCHIWDTI